AVDIAPPLSQEQPLTADESIARSLSEASADLGIAAHAYMVSPQAMTAWKEEKTKGRNGILDGKIATSQDDTLVRFVETMRKKSPGAFIELGCPAGHLSFTDYEHVVTTLKPDGLRVYGCSVGVTQEELLAWVARLIRVHKQRFLMTSASSLGLLAS